MAFALTGRRTVVADADFGGANLHQVLGILNPPRTIRDFFDKKERDLNALLLTTFVPNLLLLSGNTFSFGMADIKYGLKYQLIRHFRSLQAEYVLLDIGAGTAFNELDYYLQADFGVVVITPEPLAVQNGYHFIKLALLRRLMRLFRHQPLIAQVLQRNIDPFNLGKTPTITALSEQVRSLANGFYEQWQETINGFRPRLILNMLETEADQDQATALQIASRDMLEVAINDVEQVRYDDRLRHAVMRIQPDLIMSDVCIAGLDVRRIVSKWMKSATPVVPGMAEVRPGKPVEEATAPLKPIICSFNCALWGSCSVQDGGNPCRIRVVGFLQQKSLADRGRA
jgi:flagellar biosynthesis protein FlhG